MENFIFYIFGIIIGILITPAVNKSIKDYVNRNTNK